MSDEFIKDDTDLSLLDRTNFQVVSSNNGQGVDNFVDEVEELGRDDVSLARSPWVRIGVVVGLASFVLGLGLMLSLGRKNELVVVSPADDDESALTLELEESAVAKTDANSSELDMMRSEIALLEQQLALSSVERDPGAVNAARRDAAGNAAESSEAQTQTTQPPKPVTQSVSSVRAAPTPRPVSTPVPRSVAQPSTRTVARAVPAPASPSAPAPSSSGLDSRPEPIDPQQAWLSASTAGVFGAMPPMEAVEVQPESVAQAVEPEYRLQAANYVEVEDASIFPSDEPIPGLLYDGPLMVPMGSSAKATVVSPISWIGKDDQFVLQTHEDIFGHSEQVAIPEGSLIVVQPVSVDEDSGLAELAAVGVEIDGQMIPIDHQKVAIRGQGGDPLIAERYGDIGKDIAGNDLEQFFVGALANVGSVLNRPDSQVLTNGNFGSSSDTEFGDRNIFGAILEGGAGDLSDRMADRNEQRLNEIRSRGVIYYLPEGKEVQFYVNSEFQL